MKIIDEILVRKEFNENPPILLDIGSSGHLVGNWKDIAKYSICIAFDADKRDIEYTIEENKKYKKLYIYNCIVTDKENGKRNFFLTKSPYCSSSLEPDSKSLNNYDYSFYGLFAIEKKVKLKALNLKTVLRNLEIKKIDWFKTDSQGTDLRLFDSLKNSLRKKVLVADFEPGIIDAYKGEDKLTHLLSYMEKFPFWVSNINIGSSHRLNSNILAKKINRIEIDALIQCSKSAPTYAEITYMNSFNNKGGFNKRDYLLMWIFATLNKQHGFALEVAIKGNEKFNDNVFTKLENHTLAFAKKELRRKKFPGLLNFYRILKKGIKITLGSMRK